MVAASQSATRPGLLAEPSWSSSVIEWDAGEASQHFDEAATEWPPEIRATPTRPGYEIAVGELGTFVVSAPGEPIKARLLGECSRQELSELFHHAVVPKLHQLSGTPCIHASAVAIRGVCVAFLGPSGTGKSTLATWLAGNWPLVSDDALIVRFTDEGPCIIPSSSTARLRDDSAKRLQSYCNGTSIFGKQVAQVPAASAVLPLGGLYLLDVGEQTISLPLSPRDAILAVAQHLHRIDPHNPDLLAKEVEFLETIVRQVPVRRLLYPRSYERIAEVADALLRDFEDDEHGVRGTGNARG